MPRTSRNYAPGDESLPDMIRRPPFRHVYECPFPAMLQIEEKSQGSTQPRAELHTHSDQNNQHDQRDLHRNKHDASSQPSTQQKTCPDHGQAVAAATASIPNATNRKTPSPSSHDEPSAKVHDHATHPRIELSDKNLEHLSRRYDQGVQPPMLQRWQAQSLSQEPYNNLADARSPPKSSEQGSRL